jgi:hypothetical protein
MTHLCKLPKIYFCFPYRGIGGVSLLFLRIAEFLVQKGLAECHIVDYVDGFMAKNKTNPSVVLEVYDDKSCSVLIPPDAIAIFQSMTPWSIYPGILIDKSSHIFFWNCYPFNLIPLLPGFRRWMQHSYIFANLVLSTLLRPYKNKMRRLVQLMLDKSSLVFMDATNVRITEQYLELSLPNMEYLPIPLEAKQDLILSREDRNFKDHNLRIIWVGRVVDFKFYTLQRCLIELNRLQPKLGVKVAITIVGSGDYERRLKREVESLSNIHFKFINHVQPCDLDEFLVSNADLMLAMGTSALGGMRLGIPTILLDVAHAPVSRDYVFTWLHERFGYTLGDIIQKDGFVKGNSSLAERLDQLFKNYPIISAEALDYFNKNHEISSVASKFMKAISRCNCTYGDLHRAGLLARGRIFTIFVTIRKLLEY